MIERAQCRAVPCRLAPCSIRDWHVHRCPHDGVHLLPLEWSHALPRSTTQSPPAGPTGPLSHGTQLGVGVGVELGVGGGCRDWSRLATSSSVQLPGRRKQRPCGPCAHGEACSATPLVWICIYQTWEGSPKPKVAHRVCPMFKKKKKGRQSQWYHVCNGEILHNCKSEVL